MAFHSAFNLISDGGILVFNIKEEFLKQVDGNPFAQLIDRMLKEQIFEIELLKRYQHRFAINGQPLYYAGIVGFKRHDIPESFLD